MDAKSSGYCFRIGQQIETADLEKDSIETGQQ